MVLRAGFALAMLSCAATADGDLKEIFSIQRAEGRSLSEKSRSRILAILEKYSRGERSIEREWPVLDEALADPSPHIRGQACALLGAFMITRAKPVSLPDATLRLVRLRLKDEEQTAREGAVRIVAVRRGGVPGEMVADLLEAARADAAQEVRRLAIQVLASVRPPTREINQFWLDSLKRVEDKPLRGAVLSGFRFHAPSEANVIAMVVGALRDEDRFVRQEAIAAVIRIGAPAASAIPVLREMLASGAEDQGMRLNVDAALRSLGAGR